jgi:hypothetical protein
MWALNWETGDSMPTDPEKLSEEIWAKSQTARRIRAGISQRSASDQAGIEAAMCIRVCWLQ